ncbi:MAG: acyl-CoA dehydrogenase family protein, partial [Actinomycetota bacterium]|nr:acyl-CoA dehydrogenase family protein [Actinomycetota bacterium]
SSGHLLQACCFTPGCDFDATAAAADEIGTAPAALVDVMRDLRVPMVKAPVEVGGDLISLADQQRYFEALSYTNATAGWTGFNHAGSAGMAGALLSDAGVEEVFGSNNSPFMAAVSAPTGTFEFVDGGLEITGVYRYASGIRHAEWVLLPSVEAADRPRVRMSLVRAGDIDVGGDWDVMALKGTGSVTATVNQVFVPEHLIVDPFDGPRRGGPMFTIGYQAYVSGENLGFTLGVCQRFMDELARYANDKSRGSDGRLADRGAFQYEFGRGQLEVDAARAHGLSVLNEADELCGSAGALSSEDEQKIVAMMAYCTEITVGAVQRLFHFAGAGALFNDNILQRLFRDAQGSAQHHVASNVVFDRYGQRLLASVEQG